MIAKAGNIIKVDNGSRKEISVGAILSYVLILVQFLSGLIYTPIVLDSLGKSQYGIYSLCTSFIGYLTIMNGGANAAYIRFYVQTKVKNPDKISELNGIFLKIFTGFAFIALICGWIIGFFSPEIFGSKINSAEYDVVKKCFFYLSISSAVQIINCIFSSLVIANEKFIFSKAVNILIAILNPILTVPFLLAGYNCVVIIVIHMATILMALAVNIIYSFRKLHVKFLLNRTDLDLLKNIAQFSGFIVLQSIMDQVNWQIDKFILARTHGTEEISLYSVGSTFNKYYITFSSALASVFIAQINKFQAHGDKQRINELFIRTSRLFAYLIWLAMSAYIIFGPQFVLRWAGKEYGTSYLIGLLLMLPVTASLTMGLGQDIARAMNRHQIQIVINFAICIVNGIVSVPLAIHWGAVGSAFGTFAAEMLMCIIVEPVYFKKILGLDMKALLINIAKILPGIVMPFTVGFLIMRYNLIKPNYVSIALWGSIYVLIYGASMWLIAMNKEEKTLIYNALKKIFK